jgi:hypothetical protein
MVCALWNMILIQKHPKQDPYDGELALWRQIIYKKITFGNLSNVEGGRPTHKLDYDKKYQDRSRVRNSHGTGLPLTRNSFKHQYYDTLGGIRLTDRVFNTLMPICGEIIEELFLNDCVHITDTTLELVSQYCTQLRTLDLTNCFLVSDIGIQFLANSPVRSTLEILDISGCVRVRLEGLRAVSTFEKLRVFRHRWSLLSKQEIEQQNEHLNALRLRPEEQIISFLRAFSKVKKFDTLTCIDLCGTDNIAPVITPYVFTHFFPCLKTLRLSIKPGAFALFVLNVDLAVYNVPKQILVESAQKNTILENLELRGNATEYIATLPPDAYPMLKTFIIECGRVAYIDFLTAVSSFVAQHNHLTQFSYLVDRDLETSMTENRFTIINDVPISCRIESLHLSHSISHHGDFLNFFLTRGDTLTQLHIDFIVPYTSTSTSTFYPFERNVNAFLGSIARNCHLLKYLRLSNMQEVDYKELLVDLPIGCPLLERFALSSVEILQNDDCVIPQTFEVLYSLQLEAVTGFLQDIRDTIFPNLRHLHLKDISDVSEIDIIDLLGFAPVLEEHDEDLVQTPTSVNRWSDYWNNYNSEGSVFDSDDEFEQIIENEAAPPECLLYQLLSLSLEGIPSLSANFLEEMTTAFGIKTITHRFAESHLQGLCLSRLNLIHEHKAVINLIRQVGGSLLCLELSDINIQDKLITLPRYCPILRELNVRLPKCTDSEALQTTHQEIICSEIKSQIPHIREIKINYC